MPRIQLLAVAVFVLFAACGGDEPSALTSSEPVATPVNASTASAAVVSSAPNAAFSRAATLAAEQSGYRYTFGIVLQGVPELPGGSIAVGGAGSIDQQAKRSSIRVDLSRLRDVLIASGEVTAAELDTYLGDGKIEFIQDDDTYYLRMPFLARMQGANTPWVAFVAPVGVDGGFDDVGPLGGLGGLGALGGLGNPASPADYLAHLQGIDGTITVVGTETVRGVATTHYRGSLDMRALLTSAAGTPEERAELEAALSLFGQVKLPYDVWIDGEGLPRRLSTVLDFSSFAPAGVTTLKTMPGVAPSLVFGYELFDFGNPERIEVPAASEVTVIDLDDMSAFGSTY